MKLKELLPCISAQIEVFYLTQSKKVYDGYCLCGSFSDKRDKKIKQVIEEYGDKEVDLISHREYKISIDIYDKC